MLFAADYSNERRTSKFFANWAITFFSIKTVRKKNHQFYYVSIVCLLRLVIFRKSVVNIVSCTEFSRRTLVGEVSLSSLLGGGGWFAWRDTELTLRHTSKFIPPTYVHCGTSLGWGGLAGSSPFSYKAYQSYLILRLQDEICLVVMASITIFSGRQKMM